MSFTSLSLYHQAKGEIMKKIISRSLLLMILTFLPSQLTQASDDFVHGHKRSNGTVVESYYRTKANETINDNYSTKGNINPYTGKRGTVPRDPYGYSGPSYNNQNRFNPHR